MIDFRSDTVTRPGREMLNYMFAAEVGDDVFNEDPSIRRLESLIAGMFNMEGALFCPSGTMTNQIAIKCNTQPGDEVICEEMSHVYIYEGGGIAFNSACQVKALKGDRGKLIAEQVSEAVNPDDLHRAKTTLVCLENTTNRGGGSCYEFSEIQQIKEVCLQKNLKLHLDGARLFNALIAKQELPGKYGEIFDSISICLSKSLGAPVGSLLLGNNKFIKQARRIRKVLGGGMRQAGYLAAAGIYALEHNVNRLAIDHFHTKQIAEALLKKDFVGKMLPVETNIIIFEVINFYSPKTLTDALKNFEILVIPISKTQIRLVLHLDITEEMVKKAIKIIDQL